MTECHYAWLASTFLHDIIANYFILCDCHDSTNMLPTAVTASHISTHPDLLSPTDISIFAAIS